MGIGIEKEKLIVLKYENFEKKTGIYSQSKSDKEKYGDKKKQLSHEGLGIFFKLFEDENNKPQPYIVYGDKELSEVIKKFNKTHDGTELTLVHNYNNHKCTIKLEKEKNSINLILMDSVVSQKTFDTLSSLKELDKQNINLFVPDIVVGKKGQRQTDNFQCGVFAIQDSDMLNTYKGFARILKKPTQINKNNSDMHPSSENSSYFGKLSKYFEKNNNLTVHSFDIPSNFYKGAQSKKIREEGKEKEGLGTVLKETYEAHVKTRYTTPDEDYVDFMINKENYENQVMDNDSITKIMEQIKSEATENLMVQVLDAMKIKYHTHSKNALSLMIGKEYKSEDIDHLLKLPVEELIETIKTLSPHEKEDLNYSLFELFRCTFDDERGFLANKKKHEVNDYISHYSEEYMKFVEKHIQAKTVEEIKNIATSRNAVNLTWKDMENKHKKNLEYTSVAHAIYKTLVDERTDAGPSYHIFLMRLGTAVEEQILLDDILAKKYQNNPKQFVETLKTKLQENINNINKNILAENMNPFSGTAYLIQFIEQAFHKLMTLNFSSSPFLFYKPSDKEKNAGDIINELKKTFK